MEISVAGKSFWNWMDGRRKKKKAEEITNKNDEEEIFSNSHFSPSHLHI